MIINRSSMIYKLVSTIFYTEASTVCSFIMQVFFTCMFYLMKHFIIAFSIVSFIIGNYFMFDFGLTRNFTNSIIDVFIVTTMFIDIFLVITGFVWLPKLVNIIMRYADNHCTKITYKD